MRRIVFIVGVLVLFGLAAFVLWSPPPSVPDQVAEEDEVVVEPLIVEVFFGNQEQDPQALNCDRVFGVTREIPGEEKPVRSALEALLEGPTPVEQQEGYFTSIPPHTELVNFSVDNGSARVEFNQVLNKNAAGACRVAAIRAQITQTLLQFEDISEVAITVTGATEETTLQP